MTENTSRPLRSWLFTPATRPKRFGNAASAGADVLILDLEDSVAPADKDRARAAALGYLASAGPGRPALALRMNAAQTGAGAADLRALLDSGTAPDFLILPKAESADQLKTLDRLLTAAGKTASLVAQIESAHGLAAADEIAAATPRLAGLMFGAADMAADLGADTAWEPLLYSRSALIAACARSQVLAIDAPFFDLRDGEGLEQEVARSVALGFAAKCAVHPAQIGPINSALTPTSQAIAEARAILAENAKGVGAVNGRMVDEAIARKARRVLAAADALFPCAGAADDAPP
jgi:(S)-citramalyl-CoA lyase